MSSSQINPASAAVAPASASAGIVEANDSNSGSFKGQAAELVSSTSSPQQDDGTASARKAAWKMGEVKPAENRDKMVEGALMIARQKLDDIAFDARGSLTPRSRNPLRYIVNALIGLFRHVAGRPAAGQAPAKPTGTEQLMQDATRKTLLADPMTGMVCQQIDAIRTSTAAATQVREMMQNGSRDELSFEFGIESKTFRRFSTATKSAQLINSTDHAGRSIMEAAHPQETAARQAEMANRIELGARILEKASSIRYQPERESLKQVVPDATFRSFGTNRNNPYDQLTKQADFGDQEEAHLRQALTDAATLMEKAGQLVVDSTLNRDSEIKPEELIELARQFGIEEQLEQPPIKETPL